MDEKSVEWNDLQLFLSVAREGGLSPAAKISGRSPATLGRRMLALERATGSELFVRHERGYELTADARAFLEELSAVEARINRLTARPSQDKRPLVKVSAGSWTTLYLLERLDKVIGSPPDILLRFVAAENDLDISRREVVIGLRNARPTEENLVARKLSRVEFAPYAMAKAPRQWIRVLAYTPSANWVAKKVGGDAVCEVNTPRNCLDLALMGKGIALLPTFIGDAQKTMQKIGASVPELAHDRWIATHQDDRHLPEVRRTIDRLYHVLD